MNRFKIIAEYAGKGARTREADGLLSGLRLWVSTALAPWVARLGRAERAK